jgi:hypothetical protein
MSYFTFPADTAQTEEPLRRAWKACTDIACPKCRVAAGQYCRDRSAGIDYVTRPHRPRQDAAGASAILGPLGIHGLSWARHTHKAVWTGQAVDEAA